MFHLRFISVSADTPKRIAAAKATRNLAVRYGLPKIYTFRYYVTSGGLMSCGIDKVDHLQKAASCVDCILRGVKPSDPSVEESKKFKNSSSTSRPPRRLD
jgi:hypothetical protein